MNRLGRYAVIGGAACVGAVVSAVAEAQQGGVVCSVLSRHPCAPTVCLPGRPCLPQYPFPLGENLQLTINSAEWNKGEPVDHDQEIDTIRALFAALRACWQAPDADDEHDGMQMAVRFAFKRTGELIGEPRVTYTTPDVDPDTRRHYRDAITHALDRCTPMPFSAGMGGAIAGRPIAIRYVDNRTKVQP